ncbi:hypothetical protein [Thermococcus sp.]|uniref:hypothetical protein n=1 Tax=Thermococcus sp. TaxID=35749 RepID=UPI0026229302|nr:hypothetical protein [Thermococcus sp.]
MKPMTTFPPIRRRFFAMMKAYTAFLWAGGGLSLILTVLMTRRGSLIPALIYLTAVAFFTTSTLMYGELREELKHLRFTSYWRFFSTYSPPLGGYAILHVLVGLVFVIADILKGDYAVLAILLILKGIFEHVLMGLVENLKTASLLYDEVLNGQVDRLSLKDPFK